VPDPSRASIDSWASISRRGFDSIQNNPNADSVRYRPVRARVFSTGSIRFATALDPLSRRSDRRVRRFMRNALNDLQHP